jgi:hypothetical protein
MRDVKVFTVKELIDLFIYRKTMTRRVLIIAKYADGSYESATGNKVNWSIHDNISNTYTGQQLNVFRFYENNYLEKLLAKRHLAAARDLNPSVGYAIVEVDYEDPYGYKPEEN